MTNATNLVVNATVTTTGTLAFDFGQDDANGHTAVLGGPLTGTTVTVRGDGGTGWSRAWKINFWSRLLDGDHAGHPEQGGALLLRQRADGFLDFGGQFLVQQRVVGYRVDYEYRGQRFSTLTHEQPGAYLPVRVSVEAVGR